MPVTDVASKWQFVLAICLIKVVASSSWRLLQLFKHVACLVPAMVYPQQFICNDVLGMAFSTNEYTHHNHMRFHMKAYEIFKIAVKAI